MLNNLIQLIQVLYFLPVTSWLSQNSKPVATPCTASIVCFFCFPKQSLNFYVFGWLRATFHSSHSEWMQPAVPVWILALHCQVKFPFLYLRMNTPWSYWWLILALAFSLSVSFEQYICFLVEELDEHLHLIKMNVLLQTLLVSTLLSHLSNSNFLC